MLTPKQQAFVQEYLKDLNGAAAYRRAGYKAKTDHEASVGGSRLLANAGIAAAIQVAQQERSRRTEITTDRVLLELARVAFSDPRQLYREDGSMKQPAELDEATAAALAGLEVLEEFEGSGNARRLIGFTKKVKRWDKVQALQLLGKHLGMFEERVRHSGDMSVAMRLNDDERRAALSRIFAAMGTTDNRQTAAGCSNGNGSVVAGPEQDSGRNGTGPVAG